ncbi:hypothetical protein ECG_01847 [Echinococcus granulosus]|uniref:Zinc finger C2H2 n=1 Tax=Echinococcus granulosus TaxID=6210 RepID=A0A068WC13_ECHGR|nr:hypothetical protein ECG_01847 [Echinococcus granulosus]CDS15202.1 Zinc finger C2H2 [Echinococcus granulosus]
MSSKLTGQHVKDRNNSAVEASSLHFLRKLKQHPQSEVNDSRCVRTSSLDRDSENLFKVVSMAFQKAAVFPFSEAELLDRCLLLRIDDTGRKYLIRLLKNIFLYPKDNPTISHFHDESVYQPTELRSNDEILRSRRKRKEKLMHRSIILVERTLRRNTPGQVLNALGKLHLYADVERMAESQDATELNEIRRLARPHVLQRGITSFVCIFCRLECPSITTLQAHLISQKHHFLSLPAVWSKAIDKVRQYEIKGAITTGTLKAAHPGGTQFAHILAASGETKNKAGDEIKQEEWKEDELSTLGDISRNSNNEAGDASDVTTMKPVIAHYTTCLFCGKNVDSAEIYEGHSCTNQLEEFIEAEINQYNAQGSPLVCLLCDCRHFESPEALMVHTVGRHCAGAKPQICPLCEARMTPLDVESFNVDPCVQLLVLDRHLREAHLPHLEVIGRLFQSFDETVVAKSMLKIPPMTETVTRSYRCCFKAGESAGSGPAFPFEHWRHRPKRSFVEDRDDATTFAISHTRGLAQRPQRASARRRCLFNPQKLYDMLRDIWLRKKDRAHNTLFSLLFRPYSPNTMWCGFTASSMAQLIAHVVGHHGGNYLLQPQLRENIRQAFSYRKERRRPSLEEWSSSLLNSGRKRSRSIEALRSAVRLVKERSSLEEKRLLMTPIEKMLDAPTLIGEDPGEKLFNLNTEVDQQKSTSHKILLEKMKLTFEALDPLELCCRVNKQCPDADDDNHGNKYLGEKGEGSEKSKEHSLSISTILNSQHGAPLNSRALYDTTESFSQRGSLGRRLQATPVPLPRKLLLHSMRSQQRATKAESRRWSRSFSRYLKDTFQRDTKEVIFCHLCLEGPMESDLMLNEHIRELHMSAYADRLHRVKKRGSFALAVDPMRTCFQCYRVVESFIALQVHIVCAHGSLYPLVCGLCHSPFTLQGLGDPRCRAGALEIMREATEKVDPEIRDCLVANSYLTDIDICSSLPEVHADTKVSTFFQSVHAGLTRAIAIEEMREVRSAVLAGHAAMQIPAAFLLEAMQAHERLHVQQIRQEHFKMPAFSGVPECGVKKQKISAMLHDFSKKYGEIVNERIHNECVMLNKLLHAEIDRPLADHPNSHWGVQHGSKLHPIEKTPQASVLTPELLAYFKELSAKTAIEEDD